MTKSEILEKEMPIIISLLVAGVYEETRCLVENAGIFPDSEKLRSGMNAFFAMRYRVGNIVDMSDMDKKSFFENYMLKPVASWFKGWPDDVIRELVGKEVYFLNLEPLVRRDALTEYALTGEGEDILELNEIDLVAGLEQRMVYEQLICTNQEAYVDIRSFIIRHPRLTSFEFKLKRNEYTAREMEAAEKALCFAYENDGNNEDMVVHEGVLKYIVNPGSYEIELAEFCDSLGLVKELWPCMDLFDLGITFQDGTQWMIDVKAYQRPYSLLAKMMHDNGLPEGDYEKAFLVIPDEYVKRFKGYCNIVNKRCFDGDSRQKCVSMRTMKRLIREQKEATV